MKHPVQARRLSAAVSLSTLALLALTPASALACACGCGVFAVGTSSNFPTEPGWMATFEYDFMNQNKNWSGASSAPAENNDDKRIRTSFYTAGLQYVTPDGWAVSVELPYWKRYFKTTDDAGDIAGYNHDNFGDVRIRGSYSGFSEDGSTGVTVGVKLPTGDFTYPNFDRDTSIGTGSTDLLLGGYHVGALDQDASFSWFANGELDLPLVTQQGYRPGAEVDAVVGASYNDWSIGSVKVAPILELIGSYRQRDSGFNSARPDSGYNRLLVAPGVELDYADFKVYGNVALPVYQDVNGNQLTAPALFKLNVSYMF